MRAAMRLFATGFLLLSGCAFGQLQNVTVQGTSPTQAVISFTVPDPNDCLVQVSTDPTFGSFVDDTNDTLFTGSQKCNRVGSTVSGNNVVFVVGLRTAQKGSDGRFHSRALKCNTTHYYRIISQFQQDSLSPRSFQTTNPPLGALYPEPPPFDPTLQAFGNYAWPEFDWSDPTKPVIDPQTGLEVKPFTHPGMRSNLEQNLSWSTPFDAHGVWTNAASAATNGTSFASGAGGPTDYLFLPLPWFAAPTGDRIGGWDARWGLDDLLIRPYGSAATVDGTHNLVTVCLSIDSGQTCASSVFTITLTGSSSPGLLVPASTPLPIFKNWNLNARQGQKVPVTATVNVTGSTVTIPSPVPGQYFDITALAGSKVFIAGSSSMAPTPCVNNMCTVAAVNNATTMTIVESCSAGGCPTGATYTAAGFGLRVAKTVATGSVLVSFGYDRATSAMTDAGVNGTQEYCSRNFINVTVDRTGAPLTQNLTGYLCTSGSSDLFLFIPSNADGTARGEARLLSTLFTSGFTSNSLTVNASSLTIASGGFDPNSANTFYTTLASGYILKGIYDTSKTDNAGRPCDYREWPAGGSTALYASATLADCLTWTSPANGGANPPMDMYSQLTRAYQTGVNSLGQTVTNTPQPGFDFSFMAPILYTKLGGGLVTNGFWNGPNNISNGLEIIGTYDLATGELLHVTDDFSQLPVRYGSCHGCFDFPAGTWREGTINNIVDDTNGHPLNGAWQSNVAKVNRAGFGATPAWDTNTSLANTEAYACPPGLPANLVALGASGNNCVQVKASTEACSHIPSTSFHFANGQTEAQKFPCATNVGGTPAVPSGAEGWSKLQDTIVGDWLQDNRIQFWGGTERFIIVQKTINAANDIDYWLIRWAGCHGSLFPSGLNFFTTGNVCNYGPGAPNPDLSTHNSGWSFQMSPPFSNGNASGSSWVVLNPLSVATPWIIDNWLKASGHGDTGTAPIDDNYTTVTPQGPFGGGYSVSYNKPFLNNVYAPANPGSVAEYAPFAGKNSAPELQSYVSLLQFKAPPAERVWALDYRPINPAAGNGPEQESKTGNGQLAYNLTLLAGTTQTYQLATDATGKDSVSLGPPDPKRLPMVAAAGRYLLKDYSSAATGNVFGDAQTYGWCRVYKVNECRSGSTVGQLFVSVPSVTIANGCYTNQYERNVPCVFTNGPETANIMQFDVSLQDLPGAHQRRLGYGLAGPLRQFQFDNARATPDGKYMIYPSNWADGQRRDLLMAQLPPWPAVDAYDRTTFVPVAVAVAANPGAPNARIRFGYAENGAPDNLYCTTRQESCSTDIPAQRSSDPYSFVSEIPIPTGCANGCTITIPGISERVVYYMIDWLSSTGSVIASSPLQAQAVAGTVLPGRRRPPTVVNNLSVVKAVIE